MMEKAPYRDLILGSGLIVLGIVLAIVLVYRSSQDPADRSIPTIAAVLPIIGGSTLIKRWYFGKPGEHKDPRKAVAAWKKALQINPDDAEAYLSLGMAYAQLNRYEEAIAAYKRAIRLEVDDAAVQPGFRGKVHYNLGLAYLALSKRDSALEQYEILKALHQYWAKRLFEELNKKPS